ncbi:GvpL/GvpF family gas vesicle protein [Salipiger marinus]|uniref:GvpL/GvpF family gas vesicle protein n=1 Tax=Salipiger marinus TaxID=555512 RepID=UPI002C3C0BF3|nr:GvpL/GvpF family gas vesicle protein [Salipiger manganoxidans]MEB3420680.1 GvpL/GvpF family gas vesicle protein [Salipiger manganoxidans]
MTSVYLYGLLRRPDLDAALAGQPVDALSGSVEARRIGEWSLAYGPSDGTPMPQRRRFLKDHARVLEDLMAHGPLLPFRFGHVSHDAARIDHLITAAADEISATFERLEGHAEIGLRVAFPREAALASTLAQDDGLRQQRDRLVSHAGGSQLDQIAFGRRVAETLDLRRGLAQKALLKTLRPLARDHVLQAPEDDVQVLRAAFLVPETEVAAFTRAVEEAASCCGFADAAPEIRLVHPTPPFNFVSFSLADADMDREVV